MYFLSSKSAVTSFQLLGRPALQRNALSLLNWSTHAIGHEAPGIEGPRHRRLGVHRSGNSPPSLQSKGSKQSRSSQPEAHMASKFVKLVSKPHRTARCESVPAFSQAAAWNLLTNSTSSISTMPSFKHEVELEVSAATMWAAMKDQNEIFPKIMPEAVSSIEIVEGEGGPGSVRLVKFGPMVPEGGFVKERIVSLDIEGFSVVSEEVEGGHLVQFGFTKWVQTLKLISTGNNSSKLVISAEFEGASEENAAKSGEITKQGLTHTFKALEQYVKSKA
ncbi:hypothetical protein AXG93_4776s1230 [Marchantia polymorpha subsp. ruderalis]|uniref:Bet v I/Major latex protein domain-containing protein n=2 Tax=Marchantia polymorpha TaxID=3197 RepID=A0A176VSB3_MARPO|nr:hypothetical protein AXG93_4776s1230 [Marchantia polymorpha subsp. ruderalis]